MNYPNSPGYQDTANSKAIAEWLQTTGLAARLRDKVLHIITATGTNGATTEEVSRYLGSYNSAVGARFRELEMGGAIKRTGGSRTKPGGKRLVDVYVATGNAYTPPAAFDKAMNSRQFKQQLALAAQTDRTNRAYSERAACAVALARMAIQAGFQAGVGTDTSAESVEWSRVLYIDTPNGQVSWHIAPADQHLLEGLPLYHGEWDGTYKSREQGSPWAIWNQKEVKPNA